MIQLMCYHGTSYEYAKSILASGHFKPSRDNEGLRLGEGAYFFCMGRSPEYAIGCARQLEMYHHHQGKHTGEYAILSCVVECEETELFDMYRPECMELFHDMRYFLLAKHLKVNKDFAYAAAAVADTETMNYIRRSANISVVKCPQFFGMFPRESEFKISSRRKFPKTFVPNIVLVCADTEKARIKDIQLIEKGEFEDGSAEAV